MRLPMLLALLAAPSLVSAETIAPRDGTWTVTPRETSVGEGCPAEMVPALEGMAGQMQQAASFDVAWNGSFDPGAAEIAGSNDGVEWTRIDAQTWNGVMRVEPDAPAVGTMRMHITDPGAIESTTTIAVGPLTAAQGQELPNLGACEIELVSDMAYEG